jgi:hypothetical protein
LVDKRSSGGTEKSSLISPLKSNLADRDKIGIHYMKNMGRLIKSSSGFFEGSGRKVSRGAERIIGGGGLVVFLASLRRDRGAWRGSLMRLRRYRREERRSSIRVGAATGAALRWLGGSTGHRFEAMRSSTSDFSALEELFRHESGGSVRVGISAR